MARLRSGLIIRLGVVVALLAFAVGGYAFTATNTVPATNLGDGNNTISGYAIGKIHYTPDADPSLVDQVQFTLTPSIPAGQASGYTVKLNLGAVGDWYNCDLANAPQSLWVCFTSDTPTFSSLTQLEVVVAQ